MSGFYYLATPYTKYHAGHDAAFQEAAKQTVLLMRGGVVVFSPIVHSHCLCVHGAMDGQTDFEAWRRVNETMMHKADGLIVCTMDGWSDSAGINSEIEWFRSQNRRPDILYMAPNVFPAGVYAHQKARSGICEECE